MSDPLRFYFDFSCPWSYLALVRLQDVADRNARQFELRPVNLQTVLETENPELAVSRIPANPAKAAWQEKDLQYWARMWGLVVNLPDGWPADAQLAAAGAVVAAQMGKGFDYCRRTFAGYFGAGDDIGSADVLADYAADAGLDTAAFSAALTQTDPAELVLEWTGELIRQGGFGTPSVFVGTELFFGNDRMPLLDWFISPMSTGEFVAPGQHG